jgi:hypothetical protein
MAGYSEYLRSTSTIGFVGFLLALFAFVPMLAFALMGELGSLTDAVAVGLTVVAFLSILLVVVDAFGRRRAAGRGANRDSEERERGSGSIWELIPARQYNGLCAESGASTRGEQEEALRETQEQAAETERHLQRRSK